MWESILSYLGQALSTTLIQVLILFGVGIILAVILHFVTLFIQRRVIDIIGQGWYLGLFGWLGTIVHELGHAVFCVIFLHQITDMQLFHPDSETGRLGYVKHSYNPKNIYQLAGNLFIGVGPIILGTLVIYLLLHWLLGLHPFSLADKFNLTSSSQLASWNTVQQIFQGIWNSTGDLLSKIFTLQHLTNWQFYVFLYLVFAIGNSITLSPPDMKSAWSGFLVIVALIFLFNLATLWAGDFTAQVITSTAVYCWLLYAVVFLIVLLNIAVTILVVLPLSLLRSKQAAAAK